MNTTQLLRFGMLVPVILWTTILTCGYILDYSHVTRFVSELGAVGTSTQSLFTSGIMLCAIFNLAFFVGLFNACKELSLNVTPTIVLATFSVSMFGVSLFPAPLLLHGVFGAITLLMHTAPLLAFLLWRKDKRLTKLRLYSLVIFVVLAAQGIIPFIPNFIKEYQGLVARFFHLGWSVWYILLSYNFINLIGGKVQKQQAMRAELV